MERHFALPITIAALLHAGLLFGNRASPAPGESPPAQPHKAWPPVPIEVIEMPRPERTDADSAPPKGSTEVERPVLPERPAPLHADDFRIDVPRELPPAKFKVTVIDPRMPGSPVGPDDGRGLAGGPLSATLLDAPPRARLQAPPQYPFEARHGGRGGEVLVEFVVDEAGRVLEPRVVRSLDPIFDEPTLRAVAKWRFEPGKRHGVIVRFRMAVPVVFNLNDN